MNAETIALSKVFGGSGGTLIPLQVTENGTYTPENADGYSSVSVDVSSKDDIADSIIDRSISGNYSNNSATKIGNSAFANCNELTEVYFTNVDEVYAAAFQYCNSLLKATFQKARTIGDNAFYNDTALKMVDLWSAQALGTQAFYGCQSLDTLVIRTATRRCTMASLQTFSTTPFRNGTGGKLYVPQALIEQYKSSSYWKDLFGDDRAETYANNQILPIEGSEYE